LSKEAKLDELVDAILTFDSDKVMEATNKAVNAGIDPLKVIEDGLTKGLRIVGKKFEDEELFLMHLVAAAEASKKALNEILEPRIVKSEAERKSLGKIVIGTVAGDIHDIGKNIVASMLFAAGFEVHDLGKGVPVSEFIKKAKEVKANIVASSALLSTTLPVQHEIVKALVSEGLRDKVKIIVGGAPVTEEWVKEIGADGFGENAAEAVNVTKKVLNIKD
jgi:trimethylamine corrinoid protein